MRTNPALRRARVRFLRRWRPVRRFFEHLVSPSAALVVVAVGSLIRGWSYSPWTVGPDKLPPGIQELVGDGQVYTFGAFWATAGVALLVSAGVLAFAHVIDGRFWVGYGLTIAIYLVWTYAYARGFMIDRYEGRGYLNIVSYFVPLVLFAVVVPKAVESKIKQGKVTA